MWTSLHQGDKDLVTLLLCIGRKEADMAEQKKKYERLNNWFMGVTIAVAICVGVYNVFYSTPYYVFLAFAYPLFMAAPFLLNKLLHLTPAYSANLALNLFSFLSFGIGMVASGYQTLPGFDKFVHFLSGIVFGVIGLLYGFYVTKKERGKDGFWVQVYCAVSFSMLVAVIWEFYEYGLDLILHTDPQRVSTMGIHDTMQDMLVCFAGSILVGVLNWRHSYHQKTGFILQVCEELRQQNQWIFTQKTK